MSATSVASFVSAGILFVTLIIFCLQAHQMTRQSRATEKALLSSIYQSVTDNMLEIDRLFIERPHLRKFFYENVPLPDEEDLRQQLMAMAEFFVDFIDNHMTQAQTSDNGIQPDPLTSMFLGRWSSRKCV